MRPATTADLLSEGKRSKEEKIPSGHRDVLKKKRKERIPTQKEEGGKVAPKKAEGSRQFKGVRAYREKRACS